MVKVLVYSPETTKMVKSSLKVIDNFEFLIAPIELSETQPRRMSRLTHSRLIESYSAVYTRYLALASHSNLITCSDIHSALTRTPRCVHTARIGVFNVARTYLRS